MNQPQPLAIRVTRQRGHTIVTAAGKIDIITVPQLRERLHALAASGHPLVVNLDAVTFLGAAGLGMLATAASRAVAHGGRLQVACGRYQIRRLFLITGLHHQIPLSHTVAEALATPPPPAGPPGGGSRRGDPMEVTSMTAFPRTRAAARYALRHTSSDLTRDRAARLLRQLGACEAALAGNGQLPGLTAGLLRSLVQATRDLAGPAWLTANADTPAVEGFTALQATPAPPSPRDLDGTLAWVIWARFAPARTAPAPGSQQDPLASQPAD